MEEWYTYPLIAGAGVLAGFINTLAGSGSLITLPLLMFLGLPANIANGTNRIAILMQNIVAVSSFKQQKMLDIKPALRLAVPALLGSIAGSLIAVNMDMLIMKKFIGYLLFVMFFLILLKPDKWLHPGTIEIAKHHSIKVYLMFFGIGIYGGFIQAGVGFFLLAALVLGLGLNLMQSNAFKVFIILIYTLAALLIFIINGQVDWIWGLTLAVGNMLGAFIASRLAVKKGNRFIRYVLLTMILISGLQLTGLVHFF